MARNTKAEEAKPQVVEVDGITVNLTLDPTDDYEVTELMTVRMDESLPARERSAATVLMYRLILGDEYQRVKDELRAKNGGKLTNTQMISFVNDLIAKVAELKNSKG